MLEIIKPKDRMTSKERVRKTLLLEKTDRVPVDFYANPTIQKKLCKACGIPDDPESVLQYLGVDSRQLFPDPGVIYKGRGLFCEIPGLIVDPVYGSYSRWIENEFGGYQDFSFFPLKDASDDMIADFPVPDPDDFDFCGVEAVLRLYKDKAICTGSPGFCDIINSTGRVMGMEDALVRIAFEDEATIAYIRKKIQFEIGYLERLFDKVKRLGEVIDLLWIGEDLGTQIAPIISMELFRKVFKPMIKSYIDLADSYKVPVMVHTCGSSSWAYDEFIEMGVKAVDTLQPEAANMSPEYLANKFGGRLSLHGCISTAGALSQGTAQEVEAECRRTLDIMKPVRGYHFAPTHLIQDNTPVENIIAMYDSVYKYGFY